MSNRQKTITAAATALAVVALGGCSNEHDLTMRLHLAEPIRLEGPMMVFEGTYISDALFERIKVGETTEDWVIALLGEPTTVSELDDGTEVWKWAYRERGFNTSVVNVLGDDDKPTLPQVLTFVRVRDGTVIEKWRG